MEVAHREYGYWMREIVDCPGVNYGRVTRSLRELEVGKKGECMIARPDPPPLPKLAYTSQRCIMWQCKT